MPKNGVPIKRLALEVLAIFLGVTAGFLADDYRDYLNDRRREREILQQLLEDLALDSADIAPLIPLSANRARAMLWLNNSASQPNPSVDSWSAVLNGMRSGMFFTYEPSAHTYSALKASGDLGLIRDRQLRDTIVYYYEDRQPVLEDNNWGAVNAEIRWREELAPYVEPQPATSLYRYPEVHVTDPNGLFADPTLRNASVLLGSWYSFQESNARSMRATNASLKAAIRAKLVRW
ncbi:MAG: hypothetical protein GWN99_06500 [Gemmatimonadetes bacterium]|uniref:Uncharacterized protein n=1 Tax=Candidatus Kutchimonas denitrificans TaxID=3056748 RepID=A0AAE4Z5Z8_9BACT|nr:hypothetical protein [Gemmatimonadota bacterium]NIR73663.1 hypothetical protein [Candidatus Kutchimonas denitrificans]NIS00713.1 hypothetical protein [Gemmatimonadota bacterium]NIT66300.1 hypothetical protein [Gemmatimonadota bacterium]NIU51518.1 hypothetical protein [Gemmatimonadota bacterium]